MLWRNITLYHMNFTLPYTIPKSKGQRTTIYDSPVKTLLFSKAENNAQKFDYRMSILGFCEASFWYKCMILFVQFGNRPKASALLTGESYIASIVSIIFTVYCGVRIFWRVRNHAKITATIMRLKSGLQSGFSRSANCKLLLSES